ncbi:tetratricopeptide repeat protein [Oceanomicrobium pacificus]|uniref:Tetratricopeptide repeat protein n=1 Tax=Oceanomicrobium pacificus TaxID=2692916 RepID=A0A6B0TLC1_9RHOB|nr:tetratricopeptide repeat protein [Oceanomicrobium pacificus]MXU65330.1 tetratricopeptide repeat protein [Oceanomicrobium pacificus]
MQAHRFGPAFTGLVGALILAGCTGEITDEKKAELIEEGEFEDLAPSLNEIYLSSADPNEAVIYFKAALEKNPGNLEFTRGYAKSLSRARRDDEATVVYKQLLSSGKANNDDRLAYAEALIRKGDWDTAKATLDSIPPTYETYDRYRLEAIMADRNRDWKKADSFYEIARGLTTRPANILNNWGISNLSRGNYPRAEQLFLESITYDDKLFNPKNNLAIARGQQGNYRLPSVRLTETEEAILLNNLGQLAEQNGDRQEALGLYEEAIDRHPQFFEEAQNNLNRLRGEMSG